MKKINNSKYKKILITLILLIVLGMFITSNVFAVPNGELDASAQGTIANPVGETPQPGVDTNPDNMISDVIGGLIGGVIGLLTLFYRLMAMAAASLLTTFTTLVAKIDGTSEPIGLLTPFHIIFNYVNLLDINFFDFTNCGPTIMVIREAIAGWYYALRFLSLSILLIILIYVGIKMAISTIASEQAKYKKMLVDWAASIALVFVLHYVILSVIYLNDAIVEGIRVGVKDNTYLDSISYLMLQSLELNFYAIISTVLVCIMSFQTFGLFITFFNRMLKIGFLIVISPLITITYSIDKMGDGKAQALNNWFKEFFFTVIMQPFQCIMYIALVQTGLDLIKDSKGTITDRIMTSIVALLLVRFLKTGEKLVKKIFGIKSEDDKTSLGRAIIQTKLAVNAAKGVGRTAKNVASGTKATYNKLKSFKKDATIQTAAALHYLSNKDSSSYEDELNKATVSYNEKESKKLDKKMSPQKVAEALKQANNEQTKANIALEVQEMKQALMDKSEGTMDERVAQSQAEYEVKKRRYNAAKKLAKNTRVSNSKLSKKVREARERRSAARSEKFANSNFNDQSSQNINYPTENKNTENVNYGNIKTKEPKNANGVVDFIKGFKDPLKDVAPTFFKDAVTGGMALFGASGVYGSGGSMIEAAIAGSAFSKEFGDFMDGSEKQLKNDISDYAKINKINSSFELQDEVDRIRGSAELYDGESPKAIAKLNSIAENIISQMKAVVTQSQLDESKNNIVNILKSNPTDLQQQLSHELAKLDPTGGGDAFLGEALNYSREAKISKDMQNIANTGGNLNSHLTSIVSTLGAKIDKKAVYQVRPDDEMTDNGVPSLDKYQKIAEDNNYQKPQFENDEERVKDELAIMNGCIDSINITIKALEARYNENSSNAELKQKIQESIEVRDELIRQERTLNIEILGYIKQRISEINKEEEEKAKRKTDNLINE